MSLDVYLELEGEKSGEGSGIFIREDGQVKEISQAEWDEKFPGREPVVAERNEDDDIVYTANITHNLTRMAREANLYKCLWRPDEINITHAEQLIKPLSKGLNYLQSMPDHFKRFNPSNGWGSYEALVEFVRDYSDACIKHPEATVSVWR